MEQAIQTARVAGGHSGVAAVACPILGFGLEILGHPGAAEGRGAANAKDPKSRIQNRSRRVVLLMMGIVVLSLADLLITLAYVQANWMMEANPIADWIIRHTASPWPLTAFKACTVGVCVTLLYRMRRYASGEAAAWCAIGVLTVMSVMWRSYAAHFDNPEHLMVPSTLAFEDALSR